MSPKNQFSLSELGTIKVELENVMETHSESYRANLKKILKKIDRVIKEDKYTGIRMDD